MREDSTVTRVGRPVFPSVASRSVRKLALSVGVDSPRVSVTDALRRSARMARARATRCDRVPSRGESRAEIPTDWTAAAVGRCPTTAARGARAATWTRRLATGGDARHARYDSSMASRTSCAEVDVRTATIRAPWGASSRSRACPRMASENPGWGYTRIQGAYRGNLGHRVARTTISKILKKAGLPPAPDRPTSWRTFLRAHWPALRAADFFTTEVWTVRGLVTYYSAARDRSAVQTGTDRWFHGASRRSLRAAGHAASHRRSVDGCYYTRASVLICDRDRKWRRPGARVPSAPPVSAWSRRPSALQTVTRMQSGSFGPSSSSAYIERFLWASATCVARSVNMSRTTITSETIKASVTS